MSNQRFVSRSLDSNGALGVGAFVDISLGPALPANHVRLVNVSAFGVGADKANRVIVSCFATGIRVATGDSVVGQYLPPATNSENAGTAGDLTITYVPGTDGDDSIRITQAAGIALKLAATLTVTDSPITGVA